MFTIAQISAIIGLLLAFNVPQDRIAQVKTTLEHATPITAIVDTPSAVGSPAPSSNIPETPTQQLISSIDLKINNSDGPVEVQGTKCEAGEKPCAKITLSWTISVATECGIGSNALSPSGRITGSGFGVTQKTSERVVYGSTRITIQCDNSPKGVLTDYVDVVVK